MGQRLDPLTHLRGGINPNKVCFSILISSTNKGSTSKNILPVVLPIVVHWLFSKGTFHELLRRCTPLYIIQYLIVWQCFHCIFAGYSGCVVSRLHEDMGIRSPLGITLIVLGLRSLGFKVVSYHGIWFPKLILLCYLYYV